MLMLCLGIACIHILSVKALPEPSLESSVNCTLLFLYTVSGRNRMTAMAKVRLLAVLTMDGCPAETTGLSGRWLGSDQYGIGALKEAELSDRSNRKDGRYHQRHDTDEACG